MTEIWALAALWLGLALAATLISIWLRVATFSKEMEGGDGRRLVSFFAPFLGCAAGARWVLGWGPEASWLAGIAMSTTSVAVVYAVVGYDGSKAGRKAFDAALDLAAKHEAELFVLSVAQPPDIGDDVETEAVIENSRRYHHRLLAELKSGIAARTVKVHYDVAIGHPAEQIIYHADQHGVDLIVVGDRGHSKFVRLLLGSVSRRVVEHAGRPAMVVR